RSYRQPLPAPTRRSSDLIPYQTATCVTTADSEFGAKEFQGAVARSREYIVAGDIMKVVISQRMRRPFTEPPLSLYRALRSLNPSDRKSTRLNSSHVSISY